MGSNKLLAGADADNVFNTVEWLHRNITQEAPAMVVYGLCVRRYDLVLVRHKEHDHLHICISYDIDTSCIPDVI